MGTPIRKIYGIEVTSRCNLACSYCPHRDLKRPKVDMSDEDFDRCLWWMQRLGQDEVHLHNFGEPTLHPHIVEFVRKCRMAGIRPYISTNGVGVTRELLIALRDAGLERLSVSLHKPAVVQRVTAWCQEIHLTFDLAAGPVAGAHNWAGQTKNPVTLDHKFECRFILDREVVVLADGSVCACCIDAHGVSAKQHIWQDDLYAYEPFDLCAKCHHVPRRAHVIPNARGMFHGNPSTD